MSRTYNNLSTLVNAAARAGCTVHTHRDGGQTIYSIGSSDIGVAEFSTYALALDWATNRADGDCAEMAGGAIGSALLNDLMAADNQGLRSGLIKSAILNLATLQDHDRAAGGFAVAIVNALEIGLQHLPKGGEQ